MKRLILVLLLHAAVLCFVIEEQAIQGSSSLPTTMFDQTQNHPSLGFQNRTGPYTTPDQVSSFINFINSASSFFQNDTKARLDYISNQMNKVYGKSGYAFTVMQEGNEAQSDWAISTYTNVYAGVSAGADKIFPTKSYMFIFELDRSGRVFISDIGQKGSGIDDTFQTTINSIILSVETHDVCKCQVGSARIIADKISTKRRGDWNVICSRDNLSFYLNIYAANHSYLYTKPHNCYYGIYEV